jgi:hypothetical protein
MLAPNRMKLIALDQNVISDLALPPSAIWKEILDLLSSGVRRGTLLCPTPTETISESVHLDRTRRKRIERLCWELSLGYYFCFPWEVIAREALAKVRPSVDTFPLRIPPRINRSTDAQNEASSRAIRKDSVAFESAVNPLTAAERKTLRASGASKEISAAELGYRLAVEWLRMVRGHLNKLRNGQMIGDEQFIIQQICGTLLQMHVTDAEITDLLRNIQRGQWLEIPMLQCWFALDGLFLYDQLFRSRRYRYNDEWDKYRAGDAFHCAHCFITDQGMAAALRHAGLLNPGTFDVFSSVETKRIVAYLQAANGT